MRKMKKSIALLLTAAMLLSSIPANTALATSENTNAAADYVSIKIEAEDFTDQLGVQKTDVAGNPGVGYIHTGDYMEYSGIEIPSDGTYTLTYAYTAWPSTADPVGSTPSFLVEIDGVDVTGTIEPAFADTGTLLSGSVDLSLTAGTHTMRIVPTATGNMNFDWFMFSQAVDLGEPDVWIEGEDYSKMYAIGTENCQDVGGGRNVSSIDSTDWMEYDVTIPTTGVYDIEYRVAALSQPGKIQLVTSDGVTQTVKATTSFGATGAWQNWISVYDTVQLDAGTYKMRIQTAEGAWNLNWFKLYLNEEGTPQEERVVSPILQFADEDMQATYGKIYNDALYNISVINTVGDPLFFQAGSGYKMDAWTRDGSLNSWSAGSLIERDVAKNTLEKLTKEDSTYGTIIDQGSNQWWDMIIWSTAAWNHYVVTGDQEFLQLAYEATANTLAKMRNEHFNSTYGLFKGPSFFNDGIAGYPAPYNDNTGSSFVLDHEGTSEMMSLSTNCLYYNAYKVAAYMAEELGKDQSVIDDFNQKADTLKNQINDLLWLPESNRYAYFMHGDGMGELTGTVEDYQEGAGLAFAILFGVADAEKTEAILENIHIQPMGLSSVWPTFAEFTEEQPGRHNNIIWPQISALYAKSAAYVGNTEAFADEFDNMTQLFTLHPDNICEIYNSVTGEVDGGYQTGSHWGSCENQAWSATGYLSMVYEGIFGMRMDVDGISFVPYLRSDWGDVSLSGVEYRDMTLDISLTGAGDTVKSFKLDGVEQDTAFIPATLTGEHTVEIELSDSQEAAEHMLTVTFPKTVELSIDGESQTIANLLGKYSADVMADTELNLAFAPSVEGREIAGVTVNGEAIAEDSFDVSEYVYSAAMPNADTTIELGFTVVDKQNLRAAIEIAEGRADEAAEAVESVREKYEAALQAAKDVEAKKTATQDEINTAWSDLIDALHYLSFVAGDKSQLDIPMEIAESINRDLFTPDSLKALDEAYAAAEDLLDDEEVLEADITAAVDALYDAIYGLVYRADITELEALVTKGDSIVANADQYIQNDAWTSFETSLEEAKTVLANENATQDAVDTAVKDLTAAISALRLIPDKDALEALVGEAEAINTSKYTAKSVATMKAALSTAKAVLNDAEATEEDVAGAVEALENSIDGLVEKSTSTSSKNSGSTSANVGNAYGAAGVVSASQSVAANAYVVSDTTVNFMLKRGQAYCFKMTVVNGNAMTPGFTAGNGDVLKTQFVAKVGNDYYYRVYAIGTPGQSTGVYTTLPGQNAVKHCTVTVG